MLLASSAFGGDARLWIKGPEQGVRTGDSFTMTVILDTTQPVYAYQFEIACDDPSVLEIKGVEAGADGFVTASSVDEASGMLKVNGFVAENGVSGTGLRFLTLKVVAKARGSAGIMVTPVILSDASGNSIVVTGARTRIQVD